MRNWRLTRIYLCHFVLFVTGLTLAATADESKLNRRVQQLVADLNADQYSVRNTAHQQLRAIGDPALAELAKALDSASTEQRYRARQIIVEIRRHELVSGFTALARQAENDMDLDQGMWLIARILDHHADRDDIERKLNEIAVAVRRRLGKSVDPSTLPPQTIVDAIIHVLKIDYQFAGSIEDYDNPKNSSIARVLESRKGLPILLSHVAVSVAERLKVPLVGLSVPGRYMIKYDGSAAPEGQPKDDIIINPFDGWQILTPYQVKEIIPAFDATEHLVPCSRRLSLDRMLRNLIADLEFTHQADKAAEASEYLAILQSVNPPAEP